MNDDLISRQELIEQLSDWASAQTVSKYITSAECKAIRSGAILALDIVDKAPAVDPVRHGKWEECDYIEPCVHGFGTIRHTNAGLKCSNCVNVFKKDLLWKCNYCPNCGARMDGEHIGDVSKT